MNSDATTGPGILLAFDLPPELRSQAEALAPAVEFYTPADLEARPELVEAIEIVYGHLAPANWPRARNLRWVQNVGAGMDWLRNMPEALSHPAVLTNVHIHGVPIAEHLFGLLLMLTRGLHVAHRRQAAHLWKRDCPNDTTLPGKTLGVLGLGAVGSRSAELGVAFGMRVLGLRRRAREVPHVERVYVPAERLEMLAACDFVMNTLPLTDETRGFLGREEFAAMKRGALVFNIGRGGTIDTEAMMEALRSGRLGGAGLDVTDPEPLPADHPLWDLDNVIITPHCSGAFGDYAQHAGAVFLENLRRYLAGQPLINVVDRQAGY